MQFAFTQLLIISKWFLSFIVPVILFFCMSKWPGGAKLTTYLYSAVRLGMSGTKLLFFSVCLHGMGRENFTFTCL